MTLYNFKADIIIEASSEEEAVSQVAGRLGTIARQLGNEADLASNDPFFTLTPVAKGEPADLRTDPIADAMRADGEFDVQPEPEEPEEVVEEEVTEEEGAK